MLKLKKFGFFISDEMVKLRKFAFMLEEQCKNKEKRNDKVIVIHYIILYYIILYICYICCKQGKRKTRHGKNVYYLVS